MAKYIINEGLPTTGTADIEVEASTIRIGDEFTSFRTWSASDSKDVDVFVIANSLVLTVKRL